MASQRLAPDNVVILRLNRRIGRALARLGWFAESEDLHRRILEECERQLGGQAHDTLESCLALATPVMIQGRLQEAADLRRRAVDGWTRLLGHLHPLTLRARVNLLDTAVDADMSEIVATGPDVIRDCQETFGPDHEVTIEAVLNYAYDLYRIKKPAESLPYIRSVFSHYERLLGADYSITLSARRTLGAVLGELGDYADAITHLEVVIERRMKVLGSAHPWVAEDRELLAAYQSARGEDQHCGS